MSKIEIIKPEGMFNTVNYKSDSAGCGFIRIILPNESMNSWRYKKLQFNFMTAQLFINSIEFYKHMSFVKFQRSATLDQLKIIKHFKTNIQKQSDTPVIYESDDNLFIIPESNFARDYYKKNKPYIEEMLSLVDGITVSTGFLKKSYSKYNKNISVVKNRLCKFLWGEVKKRESFENVGEKVRIVYPGSQNHFSYNKNIKGGDIGPELMKFIKKTVDKYEWIFVGGMPNELSDLSKEGKIKYVPWVNILDYPMFLKNLKADIAIAPLAINDFNRSKSNLKMLEYTVCGLPAVYTNIDPYRNAKNTAETEEWFIHLIEMLAHNPDLRKKCWQQDYNMVKSNLYFEDNRKTWMNEHLKLFNKKIE